MNFSKKTIFAILFAALLAGCGQSATDTASSKAVPISQTAAISASATPNDLITSLAKAYPNGQMPAAKMAQAAKELAQNPAVLSLTAEKSTATVQNAKSASVQPQAVTTDYKTVTRIQNTTLTGAYFFTIYDSERDAALVSNPNWQLEGTAFIASIAPDAALSPVHRFRNKLNGSYLYTIYESEKVEITANYASTFAYEGVAWYARQTAAAGWSPLYRFRNLVNGTYLFSAYEEEKTSIEANYAALFKLEGIAYYVTLPCKAAATGSTGYSAVFKGCDANNVATYYDKTECVKDNATGLIWQGQTGPGTGLRGNDQYKTNFDSTEGKQNWNNNNPTLPATQPQINAISNSIGFKNAVNATNLCGFSNWRLPTVDELEALSTSLDTVGFIHPWFPNILLSWYWASTPLPDSYYGRPDPDMLFAWTVRFGSTYFKRQSGLRDHGIGRYGYDFYSVLLVR